MNRQSSEGLAARGRLHALPNKMPQTFAVRFTICELQWGMRIVGRDKLVRAETDHPGSGLGKASDAWIKVVEGAKWRHFMDVKATWSGVDNVPPYVVFDLKGNHFRLTSVIDYRTQTVLVLRVQTHKEYTRRGV